MQRPVVIVIGFMFLMGSARAQAPDLEKARRHFEAGTQAFQEGDYPRAELEFRAAFAITRDPVLHYNIGQAQQRRGHLEAALKSFRAYLQGVPNAEDRAEVEQMIAAIERELARPKEPPSRAAPEPSGRREPSPHRAPGPSPEDLRLRRQSAWIIGGVSLVFGVTGALMSVLSSRKAQQANDLMDHRGPDGRPLPYDTVRGEFEAYKTDAATYGGIAIGMYGAAAVGTGIATYLFLTSRRSTGEEHPHEQAKARMRVAPLFGAKSAGLHAMMEF